MAEVRCLKRAFVQLVQGLRDEIRGSVIHGSSASPPFPVGTGVKQGCVLAPTLFSLYLTLASVPIHINQFHDLNGVWLRYRVDGDSLTCDVRGSILCSLILCTPRSPVTSLFRPTANRLN